MKNEMSREAGSAYGGKKTKYLLFLLAFLIFPKITLAAERSVITDWYIQDFQSEIVVNKDSSLTITEKITADCGNLPGKHGIFRVLPTQINTTDQGTIKTPIKLISITDFNGIPYNYTTANDYSNHTSTWKIGDANKTVKGVNYYLIKYRVDNAIRTENTNFDELYWNLNGNFCDIETDRFTAEIKFPAEINRNNAQIDYYTGAVGSKTKNLADYQWIDNNTLQFDSTGALAARQGITASVTFPKNIVAAYIVPLTEKYAWLLAIILPAITFIICFLFWKKYGDDPNIDKTIIPEFDIPENLTPLELGVLKTNGTVKPEFITATIINLAVQRIIAIEETKKEGLLNIFNSKELKFYLKNQMVELGAPEKKILGMFFGGRLETTLSEIKKGMQTNTTFSKELEKSVLNDLQSNDLIVKSGTTAKKIMLPIGIVMIFALFFTIGLGAAPLAAGLLFSGIITIIFSLIMPKRTEKGAETNWKIKGFKLYMETAEKYRQQFNEKESIFEKFLPYAMVFGMTKLWIKKMGEIYGKDYFTNYHPAWYAGGAFANFDADSFTSQLNSISSSISSVYSSASGASGGGSSGGGGGGGGGGGW
jgi:uncharacterized membrane protein YgcG